MRNPLNMMRIRGVSNGNNPGHNVFGMVRKQNGAPKPHQGWDLEAPYGTPAYAIAQGKIVATPNGGAYGIQVILAFAWHGQALYAQYAHLCVAWVVPGQEVQEGDVLGLTGHSGNASGLPAAEHHLHFEVRTVVHPGPGLPHHRDPGSVLGFETLRSWR
jgi:murein DD-endopeptidase MepM/ murein hydrolase activator NlpD